MEEMISKELLSEVLDYPVLTKGYIKDNENNNVYWGMIGCRAPDDCEEYEEHINIHELAHKCKEWAHKKGFIILSGYHENNIGSFYVNCYGWTSDKIDKEFILQVESTEPEAIFKVCEWILNQKTKNV